MYDALLLEKMLKIMYSYSNSPQQHGEPEGKPPGAQEPFNSRRPTRLGINHL